MPKRLSFVDIAVYVVVSYKIKISLSTRALEETVERRKSLKKIILVYIPLIVVILLFQGILVVSSIPSSQEISSYGAIRYIKNWEVWLSPYMWNWVSTPFFGEQQITLLKDSGCNVLHIALDRLSWYRKTDKRNYIIQVANLCKQNGIRVVVWLEQDSDNWRVWGDPEYLTGQQVMNDPVLCSQWIDWGRDVISVLNPDGIHVMDEPSDVEFETYYNNLVIPSYNVYTSLKPHILVYVTGCVWYRITQWETKTILPNMIIQFHKYYDPSMVPVDPNAPYPLNYEYLYQQATTSEELVYAKQAMFDFLDSQIGSLPKDRISFGCGTTGTIEPNALQAMQDYYDWFKSRDPYELWQFAIETPSETNQNYALLDSNTGYKTFNAVGQLWADNVP